MGVRQSDHLSAGGHGHPVQARSSRFLWNPLSPLQPPQSRHRAAGRGAQARAVGKPRPPPRGRMTRTPRSREPALTERTSPRAGRLDGAGGAPARGWHSALVQTGILGPQLRRKTGLLPSVQGHKTRPRSARPSLSGRVLSARSVAFHTVLVRPRTSLALLTGLAVRQVPAVCGRLAEVGGTPIIYLLLEPLDSSQAHAHAHA